MSLYSHLYSHSPVDEFRRRQLCQWMVWCVRDKTRCDTVWSYRRRDRHTSLYAIIRLPVAQQGSEGPWFNRNLGALLFPPLHFPSLPFPSPFPPLPQPSPSPAAKRPPNPARGLGERCKLPQRGLGRSPSRNRIWCILALKSVIWWQQF